MNQTTAPSFDRAASTLDAVQTRFGLRIAARLTERSAELDADLAERLRFARAKALDRARELRQAEHRAVVGVGVGRGGAAILGSTGRGWWTKVAFALPAVALAFGLFMIQRTQENAQISTAAEVDAALLSDDLPPQAYRDAGFAEFLKSSNE